MLTSQPEEEIAALKALVEVLKGEIEPLRKQNHELLSRQFELLAQIGVLEAELKACKVLSGE